MEYRRPNHRVKWLSRVGFAAYGADFTFACPQEIGDRKITAWNITLTATGTAAIDRAISTDGVALVDALLRDERRHAGWQACKTDPLFLARFARGVFGVARGLLTNLERCLGLRLGNALGVLACLFLRDSAFLPGFLRRAFCVSAFGGCPLRGFAFG
jgi:hypothetical protein